MNRKSITQEYFILVTNEQGNFPTMRKDETKSGIVVAGFMDLLSNDIITVEKKKITVIKELPYDLFHLTHQFIGPLDAVSTITRGIPLSTVC